MYRCNGKQKGPTDIAKGVQRTPTANQMSKLLKRDLPALVKASDDAAPANSVTARKTLSQNHLAKPLSESGPINNKYLLFKPLNLG